MSIASSLLSLRVLATLYGCIAHQLGINISQGEHNKHVQIILYFILTCKMN